MISSKNFLTYILCLPCIIEGSISKNDITCLISTTVTIQPLSTIFLRTSSILSSILVGLTFSGVQNRSLMKRHIFLYACSCCLLSSMRCCFRWCIVCFTSVKVTSFCAGPRLGDELLWVAPPWPSFCFICCLAEEIRLYCAASIEDYAFPKPAAVLAVWTPAAVAEPSASSSLAKFFIKKLLSFYANCFCSSFSYLYPDFVDSLTLFKNMTSNFSFYRMGLSSSILCISLMPFSPSFFLLVNAFRQVSSMAYEGSHFFIFC